MDTKDFNAIHQFRTPGAKQPVGVQRRMEADSSGRPIYIGFALKDSASSASAWLVYKYTWDSSNFNTLIQVSPKNSVWDDRASLTYA